MLSATWRSRKASNVVPVQSPKCENQGSRRCTSTVVLNWASLHCTSQTGHLHQHPGKTLHQQKGYDLLKAQMMYTCVCTLFHVYTNLYFNLYIISKMFILCHYFANKHFNPNTFNLKKIKIYWPQNWHQCFIQFDIISSNWLQFFILLFKNIFLSTLKRSVWWYHSIMAPFFSMAAFFWP